MIKLCFVLRRLPALSREEFQRYWRESHAPLVKARGEVLKIRRYVQVHTLDTELNRVLRESRGGPQEYDGIAELWWDSEADLVAAMSSDAGRRAAQELLEDEKKFIDLASSPLWIAREHSVIER